jgi:hypothetical protein
VINVREMFKPIGWTRQSNLDGYRKGTYVVLAVWPQGPAQEVWSNVGIYSEDQVQEIVKHLTENRPQR